LRYDQIKLFQFQHVIITTCDTVIPAWLYLSSALILCDVQVLVLRLRDSVVRLGEELEQSAQAEAREKENARYYQQRLQEMRVEMEDLSQREQQSGRRRVELVTHL